MNQTTTNDAERNGGAAKGSVQNQPGMQHERVQGLSGSIQQQSMAAALHIAHELSRAGAIEPAGEDKAGRQKLRRLTPVEIVTQACEMADLLYREFSKRHWIDVRPA